MILSVSRRTDIPAFYFEWFLNRLEEGWVLVRNPYNPSSVSRIVLAPSTVECIVFWTKNAAPMLKKLDRLEPYPYYIQFTINPYGKDLEAHLPSLEKRLHTFRMLSEKLGKERVIWRYSPIVLSDTYTVDFHREHFGRIAEALSGFTASCKLSFLEFYPKIRKRMDALGVFDCPDQEKYGLARELWNIAEHNGIALSACGKPDLRPAGIPLSSCIDGSLIERISGMDMKLKKDPGQRGVCQCVESIDIGAYQTCLNGCSYCYANHSHATAVKNAALFDHESPVLCGSTRPDDRITERKIVIHRTGEQLPLSSI